MSYLSYKSPEFITDAMNNSFFMGILGNCSLTLRHDQSSDVRMLCLKPRHVQNSYQGKAIFAIRGTAMGNVQHNEDRLQENFNAMDVIADLFIGVLGFQEFAMQTSGYGQMIYNLVNSLGSVA